MRGGAPRRHAVAGAGILLCALLAGCAATPLQAPQELPAFERFVTTNDGWQLPLFHLPASPGPGGGAPLLLVHGLATNGTIWLREGEGLAVHLAEEGFEVWVAELRGTRATIPPDRATWNAGEWTVDDHLRRDAPALIAAVREASGRPPVWLGHDLGGVLGWASAVEGQQLAGLVLLGTPGSYRPTTRLAERAASQASGRKVPTRAWAHLSRPVLDLAPDNDLAHSIFAVENTDVAELIRGVAVGAEDVGGAVARQIAGWLEDGVIRDGRGKDLAAGLSGVQLPALVVAGRVDHVVPPWTARILADELGGGDVTWMVLGRGWGTRQDYGHADLLLGTRARPEVYEPVAAWLVERYGAR